MNWIRVEQVRDQVIGLRPVYDNAGNVTEIMLERAELLYDRRVLKSTVLALARTYAVDLSAQRNLVRNWLDKKNLVPFYLSAERVFIPLKMRQARAGNDETYGYLDVSLIKEISEVSKRQCHLLLHNGLEFKVLSGRATVLQSQHVGKRLQTLLGHLDEPEGDEDHMVESARWMMQTLNRILRQLDNIASRL